MEGLWAVAPEIPYHVSVMKIGGWVSLLRVNEIWELDWVLYEEHGCVVSNHIIVSFLSIELYSESSGISFSISSTSFASNC